MVTQVKILYGFFFSGKALPNFSTTLFFDRSKNEEAPLSK
jgi:hypothetical protein